MGPIGGSAGGASVTRKAPCFGDGYGKGARRLVRRASLMHERRMPECARAPRTGPAARRWEGLKRCSSLGRDDRSGFVRAAARVRSQFSVLAEAGARVIKVERPGGEERRGYAPRFGRESALFALLDRGKESLVGDLKREADRARVLELARGARARRGVRPGVMARLGLGYEALSALNPRLVYCSLTGYGQSGRKRDRAGHDINYIGDEDALAFLWLEGETGRAAGPCRRIGGGSSPP